MVREALGAEEATAEAPSERVQKGASARHLCWERGDQAPGATARPEGRLEKLNHTGGTAMGSGGVSNHRADPRHSSLRRRFARQLQATHLAERRGLLARGPPEPRCPARRTRGLTRFHPGSIALSVFYSCAITDDAHVACWGAKSDPTKATGSDRTASVETIAGLSGAVELTASSGRCVPVSRTTASLAGAARNHRRRGRSTCAHRCRSAWGSLPCAPSAARAASLASPTRMSSSLHPSRAPSSSGCHRATSPFSRARPTGRSGSRTDNTRFAGSLGSTASRDWRQGIKTASRP